MSLHYNFRLVKVGKTVWTFVEMVLVLLALMVKLSKKILYRPAIRIVKRHVLFHFIISRVEQYFCSSKILIFMFCLVSNIFEVSFDQIFFPPRGKLSYKSLSKKRKSNNFHLILLICFMDLAGMEILCAPRRF